MTAAAPLFVACNARSGSTLLRWLIDAHDEVACPGETDVATLLDAYVNAARATGVGADDAVVRARGVVDDLMARHLSTAGKTRWCDKSLSNVTSLDRLAAAWPDARFVLLHRHAMDVIASALEASEWGLDTYGLAPYAQMSPTNGVMAVAGYWIERTAAMLDFEARHPERCLRLRYEDLVTRTDAAMERVWRIAGVDGAGCRANAFAALHDPFAPADHKIWHTHAIHTDSVGRGARIPSDRLGRPVRDAMNQMLAQLGYDEVDERWGSGGGDAAGGPLEVRVVDGHAVLSRVIVQSSGRTTEPQHATSCVVAVERAALDALCSRTENFGVALKRRTVRRYGDIPVGFGNEKQFLDDLAAYLDTTGWGLLVRAEVTAVARFDTTQCDAAGQRLKAEKA